MVDGGKNCNVQFLSNIVDFQRLETPFLGSLELPRMVRTSRAK